MDERESERASERASERTNERTSGCQRLGIFPRQVSLGHPYRVDTTKAGQRRVFDCASRVLQSELTRSSDHSASGKAHFLSLPPFSLSLSLSLFLFRCLFLHLCHEDRKISRERERERERERDFSRRRIVNQWEILQACDAKAWKRLRARETRDTRV